MTSKKRKPKKKTYTLFETISIAMRTGFDSLRLEIKTQINQEISKSLNDAVAYHLGQKRYGLADLWQECEMLRSEKAQLRTANCELRQRIFQIEHPSTAPKVEPPTGHREQSR